MTRRNAIVAGTVLACFLLTAALWSAVEKDTREAKISAEKLIYNWKKGTFEFIGPCRAELKGPEEASMTAPKMMGKLRKSGTSIEELTAYGPVHFDITTKPDDEGVRQHITAECKGDAVFTASDKTVKMTGGAEAFIATIPAEPNVQPARFAGRDITINLKTFEFTVEGGVHLEAEIPGEKVAEE